MAVASLAVARTITWLVAALALAGCIDHAARGQEALGRGDYPEAERLLTRAAVSRPQDAAVWRDLARTQMRLGDLGGARVSIERAIRIRDDVSAVLLRGQILLAGGDRPGASADGTWVLERAREPRLLQELAILFVRLGQADQAIAAASRAVERSRGEAAAYTNLAVLAVELRRADVAAAAFADGRQRHPDDVPLAEAEAAFLVSRGSHRRARTAYRALLSRHPTPGLIHLALALLAHAEGDLPDAAQHARAAVDLLGHNRADVHVTYVIVLRDGGEIELARSHLRRARRRFPHHRDLAGLERSL